MKMKSLVFRIIITLLLCCLLPSTMIIILNIRSTTYLSTSDALQLYESELAQIAYHTESHMESMESSILRYTTNSRFVNYFHPMRKYKTWQESAKVYLDFISPLINNEFLLGDVKRHLNVYFLNQSMLSGYGIFTYADESVQQLEQYRRAMEDPFSTAWYFDPYGLNVYASRALHNNTPNLCYGVFAVHESYTIFDDMYKVMDPDIASLYLVDENGLIIASNLNQVTGSLIDSDLLNAGVGRGDSLTWNYQDSVRFSSPSTPTPMPTSSIGLQRPVASPTAVPTRIPLERRQYTVMTYSLPQNRPDWQIIMVIPDSQVRSQNYELISYTIYLSIFLAIGSSIVVFLFAGRMMQRTRPLLAAMRAPADHLRTVETSIVKAEDEIDEIILAYNRQIYRINQLINENYRIHMAQKQAELNALQSQVNPHFIHNLLEQLRMRLMLSGEDESSRMVLLLSRLLRHSTNWKDNFISMREEITFLGYYLELQKMRYNGRISYLLDVPETVMNVLLPRFTLQPLVENSFKHGFASSADSGHIWLRARQEKGDLLVTVEDDSSVCTRETVERISAFLAQDQSVSEDSIGIFNIHTRLRIHYGVPYGIDHVSSYDATNGTGWVVKLRLPICTTKESESIEQQEAR